MAGGKQVSPAVAATIIVIVIVIIVAIYMRVGGGKYKDDSEGLPPFAQKGLKMTPSPTGSLPPQAPSGGQ